MLDCAVVDSVPTAVNASFTFGKWGYEHQASVLHAPVRHAIDHGIEVAPMLGEAVVRRGQFAAVQYAVGSQLSQPLGQYLVAQGGDGLQYLTEVLVAAQYGRQYLNRPFGAEHIHGVANGKDFLTQLLVAFVADGVDDCLCLRHRGGV